MSHGKPHHKPSVPSFKLSSNLNQLYTQKKQQTQEFIKELSDNRQISQKQQSREKSWKKHSGPKATCIGSQFKFNIESPALIDEVPVEIFRKRSKSRLQSIQDSLDTLSKTKFNLLANQSQTRQNCLKDRKQLLKKYNINLNDVMSNQNLFANTQIRSEQKKIDEEDPEGTVKPSELYTIDNKMENPFTTPTIFQTPLLPCFASQFAPNQEAASSKTIREGEGVWRIGKIRIKKNTAIFQIGQIQYQSDLVKAEGKALAIKQDFMYKLKNWSGIWVCQPKEGNC